MKLLVDTMKINIPPEDLTVAVYEYTDYMDGPGTFTRVRFSPGMTLHTGEIEDMCKVYPALDKAYKNFIDLYHICRDDYHSKQKEQ